MNSSQIQSTPPRRGISSSTKMLLALVSGIATGLFFGEKVSWLGVIGNTVILLMQMTVFPYIVVSLIGGIGKLSKSDARVLFSKAGMIMLSLWLLGMLVVFTIPLAFPDFESASFFSTSAIADPTPIDYYKLYIPSNPFQSMAEGSVPAVVLFCIALGLALIGLKNKDQVINVLDITAEGLSRVTQGLLKVLPYGIFAMSANAAGTMSVEAFSSMQVYLICMFVLCMLLVFLILPLTVAMLTPVSYRDVVRISGSGLVTAFATGNVFIVLPVIIAECKSILAERDALNDDARGMIDILVPIAYSFPTIGKLTVILFVMFAGWFSGKPLDIATIPALASSGLLSLFGSVYVAVPFMLDLVHLPADLFQFFVMTGFIIGKFNSMVAVMNLFVLILLTITLFLGLMKKGLYHWLSLAAGLTAMTLAVVLLTRLGLHYMVDSHPQTDKIIANMQVAESVPTRVSREFPVEGKTDHRPLAGLNEIKKRGVLRVGYRPSNVPFSYYNNTADLVGFDVDIASRLAQDIGVSLEFIPFHRGTIEEGLNNGYFDIAMSGLVMSAEFMQRVNFTVPVLELTRSLVVLDHRVKDFDSMEKLHKSKSITIAYVEDSALIDRAKKAFPHFDYQAIEHYKVFFKQKSAKYDALVISAEAGSAWTLFYPDYGVAVYNRKARYPSAYAVAWGNTDLLRFMDNWIKLQKVEGIIDQTYKYWILGQDNSKKTARWSIGKDVLGWIE